MASEFLDKIMLRQRQRMSAVSAAERASVEHAARERRASARPHAFLASLARRDRTSIIAEIKRSSPSAGVICAAAELAPTVRRYEQSGAAAISVLTEDVYFGGSLDDLRLAAQTVATPLLRKDFIVDRHQIFEAAAAGASAALLIVAGLTEDELAALRQLIEDELAMDALVEVHSSAELKIAERTGARIIGVNNRNLQTMQVSLDTSRELSSRKPAGALFVCESGLRTAADIAGFKALGFDAFLIGEALMRSGDAAATLAEFVAVQS
jgi:indole-3-glycerol phosphate synthase